MRNKRDLFPLTTRIIGKPPTRQDLYWLRNHLIHMTDSLTQSLNPYVYMTTQPESTKLRALVSDLNRNGVSLWPVRFTTNARIASARAGLKHLRSQLHVILKEYH